MSQRFEENKPVEESAILLEEIVEEQTPASPSDASSSACAAGTSPDADVKPTQPEPASVSPAVGDVSDAPADASASVLAGTSVSGLADASALGSESSPCADSPCAAASEASSEVASHAASGQDAEQVSAFALPDASAADASTVASDEAAPSSPWPRQSGDEDASGDSSAEEDLPAFIDPEDEDDDAGSGGNGTPPADGDGTDDGEEEHPMTLLEHLGELRRRLVRSCLAVVIGFLVCYGFAKELFYYLSLPLLAVMPPDAKFIYTGVAEGFFVDLKVSLVAAIFVACPFIFYQIWAFIAPGLYDEEKRYITPLAFCSALFFLGGATFCYFVVFPFAFEFFMSYSTDNIVAMLSINEYLGFALKMLIAFGIIFEMPLFSFFLSRMGIVTAARMRSVRKYAVLAIFIIAAILTPPDVFSQLMMAGPMLILYEISIWVAVVFGRRKKNPDAEEKEKA